MSDDSYFENDEDQDDSQDESNVIKELRKQNKDLKAKADKASRVDELERQLLLHQAGLGKLKPVQVKALLSSHEGEWDAESIQVTATELGFKQAESTETTEEETNLQISDEERQAHRLNEQAGGKYVHRPDPEDELIAKIKATESEEELIALLEANPRSDGSSRLRTY